MLKDTCEHLIDVAAILIMRLFECHNVGKALDVDEFVDAIELIESYVFRRAICEDTTLLDIGRCSRTSPMRLMTSPRSSP